MRRTWEVSQPALGSSFNCVIAGNGQLSSLSWSQLCLSIETCRPISMIWNGTVGCQQRYYDHREGVRSVLNFLRWESCWELSDSSVKSWSTFQCLMSSKTLCVTREGKFVSCPGGGIWRWSGINCWKGDGGTDWSWLLCEQNSSRRCSLVSKH